MNSACFRPSASFTSKHFRYASTSTRSPGCAPRRVVRADTYVRLRAAQAPAPSCREGTLDAEMLGGKIRTRILGQFRLAAVPGRIELRQIGRPAAGENLDRIRVRGRALLESRRAKG